MSVFKKQGVAWTIAVVMIFAAIGIGLLRGRALSSAPNTTDNDESSYYVYDNAGVLSSFTEDMLSQRNRDLLDTSGVVVAVVTCNYGRSDLGSYALDYAGNIGLGGYDMIVVLDISGQNYWLLQGADLIGDFTDDDCSDYAYRYLERDFARGNYDGAVLSLTKALADWYYSYF